MKRIIVVFVCLLTFLFSGVISRNSVFMADEDSSTDGVYKWIDVHYPDSTNPYGGSSSNEIFFNTEYFFEDNTVFHRDIAKCSMALSAATYNYKNISDALTGLGFSFDDYTDTGDGLGNWARTGSADDNDFVRYIIAERVVTHNNEQFILYCIPVQGTLNDYNWISNFNIGEGENHEGFYTAREEILLYLYSRMQNDSYDIDHTIVWTTGHSRGGAVANIIGGELTAGNSHNGIGDFSDMVKAANVFAYTFATPNVSRSSAVTETGTGYKNIFNIINSEDFITKVPFTDWGFGRYGVDVEFENMFKDVVDFRYENEFEHDFKSNSAFADILSEEIVPMIITNQIQANDVVAKAIMHGFAYLMNGGHDFKTYLEYVGFFIEDNFWEIAGKIAGAGFPDIQELLSYHERYQSLIPVIKAYTLDTNGMTQEQFDQWLTEHRSEIDEIEDVFDRNIKTRQDLLDIVLILPMDVVFTFLDMPISANDAENALIIFGDLYGYFHDMEGEYYGIATIMDAHSKSTYTLWTNAQYLGSRGFFEYAGKNKIVAFDDEMIRTIGNECFYKATGVTHLIMNDNIEYLGFNVCQNAGNIEKITLSDSLRNIPQNAFMNCTSWIQNNLVLPETLEYIGEYAFFKCNKITGTLTLPDAEIGFRAFNNCTGLTELVMPVNRILDGFKRIQESAGDYYHPFTGCSSIVSFKLTGEGRMPDVDQISDYNAYQYKMKGSTTPWGAATYENGSDNRITVEIGEGITRIGSNAFVFCDNLVSIIIPETVTSIGYDAFMGCTNMVNASIPANVTFIDKRAFMNCYSFKLNDFTIPETLGALNECVFMNCRSFTGTLTIPETVTINEYAFVGCSGLTGLVIPLDKLSEGFGNIGINSYDYSPFALCSSLHDFVITGSGDMKTMRVANSEASMSPIYAANQRGATDIHVTLNEGIKSIGYYAFFECENLTELHLPSTLSGVYDKATYKCNNVTVYYPGCEFEYHNIMLREGNNPLRTIYDDNEFVFDCTSEMECEFDENGYVENSARIVCRKNGVIDHYHSEETNDFIPVVEDEILQEPTCAEEGRKNLLVIIWRSQRECDYIMSHEYPVAAIGHTAGQDYTYTYDPTCEEDGYTQYAYRCTVCGQVYDDHREIIPALGHSYGDVQWHWNDDGTVTADWLCERKYCGNYVSVDAEVTIEEKPATREEEGYLKKTATAIGPDCRPVSDVQLTIYPVIGDTYQFIEIRINDDYTEAFAVYYDNYNQKSCEVEAKIELEDKLVPTCENAGWDLYSVYITSENSLDGQPHSLGDTYVDYPALGHDWDEEVIREATCVEEGLIHRKCRRCDEEETEETELAEHKLVYVAEIPATCTEAGRWDYYECSVCHNKFAEEDSEFPIDDDNNLIIRPTGHDPANTVQESYVETTCTQAGGYDEVIYCSKCHAELERWRVSFEALGHLWDEPTYTWSDDYGNCTAQRICLNDSSHKETETVNSKLVSGGETCGSARVYEVVFSNTGFETQRLEVPGSSSATEHSWDDWIVSKQPTCTEAGSEYRTCANCGTKETREIPALNHKYGVWTYNGESAKTHTRVCANDPKHTETEPCKFGEGKVNGDIITYTCNVCQGSYSVKSETPTIPEVVGEIRVAGPDRFGTCKAIATTVRKNWGVEKLDTVILASGTNFADALAGSYLAAVKSAPIIITRSNKAAEINTYIKENLKKGGTVYVLGGTAAVPETCLSGLSGFKIIRLAGDNRYLTNLEILKEAGMDSEAILVATGTNFADSLSASASGLPMLLVKDDGLTDEQKAFLSQNKGKKIYILGGTGAVKPVIESILKSYGKVERIAGSTRFETSYLIAGKFYPNAEYAVLAFSNDYPDGLCGGPLAYQIQAPLILTRSGNEDLAARYVKDRSIEDGYVLGGTNALPDSVVVKIFGHRIDQVIDK